MGKKREMATSLPQRKMYLKTLLLRVTVRQPGLSELWVPEACRLQGSGYITEMENFKPFLEEARAACGGLPGDLCPTSSWEGLLLLGQTHRGPTDTSADKDSYR